MASKSVGQIVGTLAGAVIGSFIPGGYVALGASIGGMVGGLIDPPKSEASGPRLSDLSAQATGYGNPIPRAYGQIATYGTVFWVEGNKIHEVGKTKKSGKGGGGSKYTTYSYDATFAVSLCEGPIAGIRRIWIGGKLVFDGFATSTHAILQSDDFQPTFTLYRGTDDQLPDPRIQADLGIANTPAWRGMAYIVFNNLPLEDFGNTLMGAQVKVELITTGITNAWQTKLLRDEDMDVSFESAGINGYIKDIDNGIATVSSGTTSSYYLFDLATGNLVSRASGEVMMLPAQSDLGWSMLDPSGCCIGRASNGKYVYAYTKCIDNYIALNSAIGYSPFSITMGPEYVHSVGGDLGVGIAEDRVSMSLSPHYKIQAVGFNKGNSEIFVMTTEGWWYLIDLSGNIIEKHISAIPYLFGGNGRWLGNSAGSCAVDMSVRRIVCGIKFGVSVYSVGANGVITLIADYQPIIGTAAGGFPATIPLAKSGNAPISICIDGNIVVLASQASFQVIVYGAVSTDPITLGEIVQTECLSSGLLTTGDIDVSELTDTVRGYKVAQPGQIRNALDPLRKAWPFDVVQRGYKIKFPKRGKTSAVTIPVGDLVIPGGESGILTVAREMDSQLPRRIEVSYLDVNREYDQNSQSAERLNTDAINEVQAELPIVLDAGEAARAAEVLLYASWLERADLSFSLPPIYGHLEAGDVVTVVAQTASYELRIASLNSLPDGRIEISAKPNSAATYTSTAVGQEGAYTGQQMTLPGPAELLLLDVPCIDSRFMNEPGLLVGMSPYLDAWKGGAVARSDDAGQTWGVVDTVEPPGTLAGMATTTLAAGVTHIVDTANTVDVSLHGGTLTSVTDAALFNGANHFAIGAHGRWEIVAAKTVVDHGNSRYTLSNLMRGRFGTEWAMSLHTAADTIVLLDTAALRFVNLNPSAINAERLWRGVNKGQSIDAATETALTYSAVNLKPLAPIRLRGNRNPATLDWTIEWERRSRFPVEPFSGVATPLGETSEAYEVEILDATFSTLKRTITGLTTKSATWTQAQQISDFGGAQISVALRVYPVSSIVGRGYPLQSSLSHNLSADPYIEALVFGLHMDGANGSTTFTDVRGKAVTANGNAQLSTTSPKFGTACGTFDGAGDFLSFADHADFDFGSDDLTIDFWFKTTQTSAYATLAGRSWVGLSGGWTIFLNEGGSGPVSVWWADFSTGGPLLVSSTNTHRDGVWHHFAWTRSGNTHRMFIDGTQVSSATTSTNFGASTQNLSIGTDLAYGGRDFNGQIDDFRITRACRWTSNFTPPTEAFPDP